MAVRQNPGYGPCQLSALNKARILQLFGMVSTPRLGLASDSYSLGLASVLDLNVSVSASISAWKASCSSLASVFVCSINFTCTKVCHRRNIFAYFIRPQTLLVCDKINQNQHHVADEKCMTRNTACILILDPVGLYRRQCSTAAKRPTR